ncbi:MAG: hypothetical protein ACRCWW_08300 [Scandinavium sp.]|uniref:hypothetical protein n=1 Tax=Scandinavium sp. TaxID=2830653 RepID=UPI003F3EDB9D
MTERNDDEQHKKPRKTDHLQRMMSAKANEITKLGIKLFLANKQFEQLKTCESELLRGEDPIAIQGDLRPHDITDFLLDKYVNQYRENYGYIGGVSADLYASKDVTRQILCEFAATLIEMIADQVMENIATMETMLNLKGTITTPGHEPGGLYAAICKSVGVNLDTSNHKEKPAIIKTALESWQLDNAFAESCRIMRHWAKMEHTQRTSGGKGTQPVVTIAGRDEIREQYIANPGISIPDLMRLLQLMRWNLPGKRTIERYTKDLRQCHKR